MQMGGHVGEVFGRLKEGVKKIEAEIPFSSDPRLGMLTFCPTNLGTTIRSVSGNARGEALPCSLSQRVCFLTLLCQARISHNTE